MGRLLESPDYDTIVKGCQGLELADSITGDGHKLLNVPYDCGFFLSRHRDLAAHVFQNPNAAYLASSATDNIMSPLNIGLENSRRFRALPVYASLTAYGSDGYRDMLERQIQLARGIAQFLLDNTDDFELLPKQIAGTTISVEHIYIIVLFRAKDEGLNRELVNLIKSTRKIYVSGTAWRGKPACRFAVSNWQADVKKDLPVIKEVLTQVVATWKANRKE
jgi:glutamate/tyrosine decarboxylase-like PLP-dependent enzyme